MMPNLIFFFVSYIVLMPFSSYGPCLDDYYWLELWSYTNTEAGTSRTAFEITVQMSKSGGSYV